MKNNHAHLFLLLYLLATFSCRQAQSDKGQLGSSVNETFDPTADYFPDKATFEFARHVEVEYHGHYKVVKTSSVLASWSGGESKQQNDVMVLVQRGTPAPELKDGLAGAEVIQIPVERVALNVVNAESFLQNLELTKYIVAIGGLGSYQDTLRDAALTGKLGQVGYSWHQPPQMEVLLERRPDVFLMQLSNLDYQQHLRKCREMGIPTATVFEWAEEHYLGRAEWIKYFSLFFNEEAKANEVFDEVKQGVDILKQLVQTSSGQPTAIWGYYAGKDRWWLNTNNIEAQLLQDAGITNVFENKKISTAEEGQESVSSETLLQKGREAEHWIIGDIHSVALPPENFMQSFNAWKKNKLYHNMKRSKMEVNAFDWYGTAIVRPDWVLADLVGLIHPELLPGHSPRFLDTFEKNTVLPILRDN
ncbi:ABC-type Fe3+-hydroxamate transport system substrate-binding protein [Algoriphagus sp. 4150]|uniref:ABC transporter substrate-binding protein n=1 Tax=Algoriphagus sp. 4150 TaxID=2817756 RepID=UPI00286024DA|nr:ABC transporter substrate-binding protein [Algoriphagus sp. 4150]MDR7132218.1 ABC-type Fe3+-hydroxamate transport system substrate-binding protein [Algoriphagus sp. 4150]